MARYKGRNHFIVRHDLASLQVLPGCIWNSEQLKTHVPTGFRQIHKGDRWVGFAYTTSENREKAVSMVTGFYESTVGVPHYGKLPSKAADAAHSKHAWMIKGDSIGGSLIDPVVIPPINNFLDKKLFNQRTISRISKAEFDKIRQYAQRNHFSPKAIPCLKRDPRNEQEVLAIVASTPEKFGIERIVRVQTRFPDMLVKLRGKAEAVHLELELYSSSFLNHDHHQRVARRRFVGTRLSKGDGKEVGVLCWLNDDDKKRVRRHVHAIYELRSLIKYGERIRW